MIATDFENPLHTSPDVSAGLEFVAVWWQRQRIGHALHVVGAHQCRTDPGLENTGVTLQPLEQGGQWRRAAKQ